MQTSKYKQWIQILKSAFFFSPHLQLCAFPCPHLPTLSSLPSTWSTRSASCQAPWPPLTLTSLSTSSAPGIQVFIAIEYWIFIQTRFRPTQQQFRARDTVKLVTRILWQSILQGLRYLLCFSTEVVERCCLLISNSPHVHQSLSSHLLEMYAAIFMSLLLLLNSVVHKFHVSFLFLTQCLSKRWTWNYCLSVSPWWRTTSAKLPSRWGANVSSLKWSSYPCLCFLWHWRKNSWRPVAVCSELKARQTCNLTKAFKDPFDHYKARVQAIVLNQTSNWTVSEWFQPLSDSETLKTLLTFTESCKYLLEFLRLRMQHSIYNNNS